MKTGPKGTLSTPVVMVTEDSDPNQDRIDISQSVTFLQFGNTTQALCYFIIA